MGDYLNSDKVADPKWKPTCHATARQAVEHVSLHAKEWRLLPPKEKANLLGECLDILNDIRPDFLKAALNRRHYAMTSTRALANIRHDATLVEKALIHYLTDIHLALYLSTLKASMEYSETGDTASLIRFRKKHHDGTEWIGLHFFDPLIRRTLNGVGCEVHAEPEVLTEEMDNAKDTALVSGSTTQLEAVVLELENAAKTRADVDTGVMGVLGAGNYDAPMDILTGLIVENRVIVYKASPLATEALETALTRIFFPFIQKGFLAFIRGGEAEGAALLEEPGVVKWCMTGSSETARKILFGLPSPSVEHKEDRQSVAAMKVQKPFILELGGITPYIICPGEWSDYELECHARHLAWGLLLNGGHLCAHVQVVLTCQQWPQRVAFLTRLRTILMECATVGHFYPKAEDRFHHILEKVKKEPRRGSLVFDFEETRTSSRDDGEPSAEASVDDRWSSIGHTEWLPLDVVQASRMFLTDITETSSLLNEEAFCCAAGELALDTEPQLGAFLERAVDFVNHHVPGSLATTIIVKTASVGENEILDRSILNLRYGVVAVNINALSALCFPQLPWGGYPKLGTLNNLSSGIGKFGNCLKIEKALKGVLRCSFLNPLLFLQVIPTAAEASRLDSALSGLVTLLCSRYKRQPSVWGQVKGGFNFFRKLAFGL